MTAHVKEIGIYLSEKLEELKNGYDSVIEIRGTGLIQGIRMDRPVGEITRKALDEGLLIINARSDVIRLVPPLIIEKEHVDEFIEKLKKVL